jgi:hypothetical protein
MVCRIAGQANDWKKEISPSQKMIFDVYKGEEVLIG